MTSRSFTPPGKRLILPAAILAGLFCPTAAQAGQYELSRTHGQGTIYRTVSGQSLPPQSITYDSDVTPEQPYPGFPLPPEDVWGTASLDLSYTETYVIRWVPAEGETLETDPPQPDTWGVDWDSLITWGSTSGMQYDPASMSAYTKGVVSGGASYQLDYGFQWTPPGPPEGSFSESGDGDGDLIGWLDFAVNGAQIEVTVTYTASMLVNGPAVGHISLQRNRAAPARSEVHLTQPARDITVITNQLFTVERTWSTTERAKPGAPTPSGENNKPFRIDVVFNADRHRVYQLFPEGLDRRDLLLRIAGTYRCQAFLYLSDGKRWVPHAESPEVRTITVR